MFRLKTLFAALCLAPTLALAQMATAPFEGRLKKIQETKTISVAYRTDALPFSFEDAEKKPSGYMVELCRSVIGVIERQIGVTPLQVKWVPVTVQNRFSTIASGQADMECGATTVTLGRMKEVGFSSLTFVDGTGLLIRNATAGNSLMDLANKKIGVIAGTSNERALAAALQAKVVTATVVPLKSREEGLAQLEAGTIDAFASDRVLLVGLASKAKDPKAWRCWEMPCPTSPMPSCCRAATGPCASRSTRRWRRSTAAAPWWSSTTAGSAPWAAPARCLK